MQKHHPVVKDENYNLQICDSTWSPIHITRKEKINGLNDVDGVCYLLPFSQSNLILTILSLTFFPFLTCPPITKCLTKFKTHPEPLLSQRLENSF